MARHIFQGSLSPSLNFATKKVWMIELSCVNVIQYCMMIGWTYLESSSFILFASNLKQLVIEIPEGICSKLYFYAHFTRASQQKVKTHIISQKCLFQDRSSSLGNLRIVFLIGEVVFPPTPILGCLSQDLCQRDLQYL